jgi:membrane protein YdbS with pleckstrin-like domain
MADELPKRSLLDGETLIWEGRPSWKAWAGATVLGWVLVPAVIGIVILLTLAVRRRAVAWMISTRRIEVDVGWLSHRIDTLELWRVKDVEFQQGFWDRIAGVSSIVVTANDQRDPTIAIRGLPGDRGVYDKLSNAVMAARQQRGVLNLNQ